MSNEIVIILAEAADLHAQAVKYELLNRFDTDCHIIDTANFPSKLVVENRILQDLDAYISLSADRDIITTKNIIGVWRRRIKNHEISAELT